MKEPLSPQEIAQKFDLENMVRRAKEQIEHDQAYTDQRILLHRALRQKRIEDIIVHVIKDTYDSMSLGAIAEIKAEIKQCLPKAWFHDHEQSSSSSSSHRKDIHE